MSLGPYTYPTPATSDVGVLDMSLILVAFVAVLLLRVAFDRLWR